MRKYMLYSVALALAFAIPAMAEEAAAEKKAEKPKTQQFTGEITAVDASSITLKNTKGETKTLKLAADCKITGAEKKAITCADLKVGQKVMTVSKEDGTCVRISPPAPPKPKDPPKKEGEAK